jgi:hypothetical protein
LSCLPSSLRISVENFSFGKNWRKWVVYMKIDEDDKIGGDNCFVGGGSDEDILYVDNISVPLYIQNPGRGYSYPQRFNR